jgi:hypothetical protein
MEPELKICPNQAVMLVFSRRYSVRFPVTEKAEL